MSGLTNDRNTPSRQGRMYCIPAAPSRTYFVGALLCVNVEGLGVPGSTATGLRGIGRVTRRVVSGPGTEDLVDYERGVFRYLNSTGTDLLTRASIGLPCYVVDDQTVARTDGAGTRSMAGIVDDVDHVGVWVRF